MADMLVARFAACGLPVVTVLPTIVLGEGDRRPTPTGSMIVHFINRRMKAYVEMPQNLVHVGDVADGHVQALERGRTGHRYILGGDDLDMRSVVRILAEITGIPAPRIVLPQKLFRVLAVAEDWLARSVFPHEPLFPLEAALHARDSERFCTDKARKELGFQPRPAEVVLRRAVAWFVADGHCKNRLTRKAIQAKARAKSTSESPTKDPTREPIRGTAITPSPYPTEVATAPTHSTGIHHATSAPARGC